MTKPIDPFSRVYWRVIDDPKFVEVYADDHAFALWVRLLMAHDMAWPASAALPFGTKRSALKMLTDAGIVDLVPGSRFRVHGLDAERGKRQKRPDDDSAPAGTDKGPGRDPGGNRAGADRDPHARTSQPSRAKTEEPSLARLTDAEQRGHLDGLKAAMESSGIPLPKPNGKPQPIKAETEPEYIARLEGIRDDETEVGWKREAAKAQLEAMRLQP